MPKDRCDETCLALVVLIATSVPGLAQSCQELWYQRNAVFKEAGSCFETSRAIREFGNAGCRYDEEADVPLSQRQRREVNALQRTERALGCAR